MQKQISKNIGLVFLLFTVSCASSEARNEAIKSFRVDRDEYGLVVSQFKEYRDSLECAEETKITCKFTAADVSIDEKLLKKLNVETLSSDPLAIQFKPVDSIYAKIWYAETQESKNYIKSPPYDDSGVYTMHEVDDQWFLVTLDWN